MKNLFVHKLKGKFILQKLSFDYHLNRCAIYLYGRFHPFIGHEGP